MGKIRAAIVTHYNPKDISGILKKNGFALSKRPKFVFTYGGDGTILEAEKKYPGIPIVPVQRSRICRHCEVRSVAGLGGALGAIRSNKFTIAKEEKIELVHGKKVICALNEIQVHIKDPRKALRFSLKSKNINLREVVGDGIVASTSYASDAYYRAIGCKLFGSGLRIGFNNVWPRIRPIRIAEPVRVTMIRQNAYVAADNFYLKTITPGESIIIRPSNRYARFVIFKKKIKAS
jgi:NAD kinase